MTNTTRNLGTDPATCRCGCGQETVNAKARFRAGHDQRLVGILVRAQAGSETLVYLGEEITPAAYAEAVYSQAGLDKVLAALAKPRKANGKTQKAKADEPAIVTIRIGRWTKEATVTQTDDEGNPTQVSWVAANGKTKTTDRFQLV